MSLHAEQFAIQIRVNAGSPSEYWDFDSDFGIHTNGTLAWGDLDVAESMGYGREDLRVVAIAPMSETGGAA